jgi:hypothetical protein
MPIIQANGCDFYYEQHGQGRDMVFIHGEIHGLEYWEHQLAELLRGMARLHEAPPIPGAARFVNWEKPDEFNAAIRAFLRSLHYNRKNDDFARRRGEPSSLTPTAT